MAKQVVLWRPPEFPSLLTKWLITVRTLVPENDKDHGDITEPTTTLPPTTGRTGLSLSYSPRLGSVVDLNKPHYCDEHCSDKCIWETISLVAEADSVVVAVINQITAVLVILLQPLLAGRTTLR